VIDFYERRRCGTDCAGPVGPRFESHRFPALTGGAINYRSFGPNGYDFATSLH